MALPLFLLAVTGPGCGGPADAAAARSGGPARLEPGLGDEAPAAGSAAGGPIRVAEEAVDPPPVEPPP